MNYIRNDKMIFLSLVKGEEINNSILEVAISEKIDLCWINGIGLIENVDIGYYSIDNKSYKRNVFEGNYELTSLMGNISIKDNEPFVHNHITFSDKKYNSIGGHLFSANITATGELCLFISEGTIMRKLNNEIGLHLWCL